MRVNIPMSSFAAIQERMLRYNALGDPADLRAVVAEIKGACALYGGDFNEGLALLGVPTELVVIEPRRWP